MSGSHGHHHQQVVTEFDHADAWHTHTVTEGAPQEEHAPDIAFGRVFWLGVAGFMIIVVATYATWEYYKHYTNNLRYEREEAEATQQDGALAIRKDTVYGSLKAPAAFVKDGNYIHVPVDEAAQRVMKRYAR